MEKKKNSVIIFTDRFEVQGILSIKEGFRLTDYLNTPQIQFIPLVKVKVKDFATGEEVLKTDYICLNKDSIIFAKTEGKNEK